MRKCDTVTCRQVTSMDGIIVLCCGAPVAIAIAVIAMQFYSNDELARKRQTISRSFEAAARKYPIREYFVGVDGESGIGISIDQCIAVAHLSGGLRWYRPEQLISIEYSEDGVTQHAGIAVQVIGPISVGSASSKNRVQTIQLHVQLADVDYPYSRIAFLNSEQHLGRTGEIYRNASAKARTWKARLEAVKATSR